MDDKLLIDEQLEIVYGGVLKDGWQDTVLKMISIYKVKYGDEGKQKLKDTMALGPKDPTSPMNEDDLLTIYAFIDNNWN